jgi:hypothetical protein
LKDEIEKKNELLEGEIKKGQKKQVNLYQPVNPVIGVMRSRQPYKKQIKKL